MEINTELQDLIPELTKEEYETLEKSIIEDGVREPLITWQGYIVDGHNRFEIAQKHGIRFQTKEKHFDSIEVVKVWMIDNQKARRNLTDGWKYELALVKKRILAKKGKETQGKRTDLLSLSDKKLVISQHNTREEIAKELGWSTGKTAHADYVWQHSDDEVKEKVRSGEFSIKQAYNEVKKEKKKEERKIRIEEIKNKLETEELEQPTGLFDVIVIDPPWDYKFNEHQYDPDVRRGNVDYPTTSVTELKQSEIPAKDDCILFLWTTHAFLRDAFDLLDTWDFKYIATLVWDKEKIGIGRNIRLQVEFCLMAKKGSPIIYGDSERDIIREPRREHSRKPEEFYSKVERMTVGRKLDYFGREAREGWCVYGAEAEKFSNSTK